MTNPRPLPPQFSQPGIVHSSLVLVDPPVHEQNQPAEATSDFSPPKRQTGEGKGQKYSTPGVVISESVQSEPRAFSSPLYVDSASSQARKSYGWTARHAGLPRFNTRPSLLGTCPPSPPFALASPSPRRCRARRSIHPSVYISTRPLSPRYLSRAPTPRPQLLLLPPFPFTRLPESATHEYATHAHAAVV